MKRKLSDPVVASLIGLVGAITVSSLTLIANRFMESERVTKLEADLKDNKTRLSRLQSDYDDLLERKDEYYRRRIAYQVEVLDRQAQKDFDQHRPPIVEILGINATGVLHQGREKLLDILQHEGSVRILLLNPESDSFRQRTREEKDEVGRLTAELHASFYILADIVKQIDSNKTPNLEVRMHSKVPDRSLVMVDADQDDGVIMENPYPKLKGERGVEGEMFKWLQTGKDARGYQDNRRYFRVLWNEAVRVNPPPIPFQVKAWPYETAFLSPTP